MPLQSKQLPVHDEELSRFATSQDARATMSVIIEAVTPPVRVGRSVSANPGGLQRRSLGGAGSAERSATAQLHLGRIAELLDKWQLSEEPLVLPSAHAVVASVTPKQLRQLLELPDVAMIRRNQSVTIKSNLPFGNA